MHNGEKLESLPEYQQHAECDGVEVVVAAVRDQLGCAGFLWRCRVDQRGPWLDAIPSMLAQIVSLRCNDFVQFEGAQMTTSTLAEMTALVAAALRFLLQQDQMKVDDIRKEYARALKGR